MGLYVLFGIPASGKTTLACQMKTDGCVVHSYDDIRNKLEDRYDTSEITRQWIEAMKFDLLSGYNVVCDCQCLKTEARKLLLREFSDIPCHKTLIAVVTPVDVCVERNAKREGIAKVPEYRIRDAAKYMQPPTKDEGWDKIIVYRN